MGKAVLISIRPTWCALIAAGRKTVEIRKNRPNLETPFKCYIYCTKAKSKDEVLTPCNDISDVRNGKVIGEFVCDEIAHLDIDSVGVTDGDKYYLDERGWKPCLTRKQIIKYCGIYRPYGWHISELKIYDEPKEFCEFWKPSCERVSDCGACRLFDRMNFACGRKPILTRPPQSWCYVGDGH